MRLRQSKPLVVYLKLRAHGSMLSTFPPFRNYFNVSTITVMFISRLVCPSTVEHIYAGETIPTRGRFPNANTFLTHKNIYASARRATELPARYACLSILACSPDTDDSLDIKSLVAINHGSNTSGKQRRRCLGQGRVSEETSSLAEQRHLVEPASYPPISIRAQLLRSLPGTLPPLLRQSRVRDGACWRVQSERPLSFI